jgi:hypothetical protein
MPVLGSVDARAVEQEFEQLFYGTLHKTCAGRACTLIGASGNRDRFKAGWTTNCPTHAGEGKRWIAGVSWSGAGAPVCQCP